MSHDHEAIRRLTQSYRYLRGLETLPLAVVLLGTVLAKALGFAWSPVVFVVLAALALPAMRAIRRYYDRRFGVVKGTGWGGGTWAVIVVTFVALQIISKYFALPVQLGVLAAGIGAAAYALRRFELHGQHLVPAAFLVMASVWPTVVDPRESNELWQNVLALGFAAIWVLMGLWDHRTLVKAFERARLTDTAEASSSR